jgi:DNA repair exonuclease SbcCD ATPase subunit
MEVQDCSVSTDAGAELDYRFPVLIKTPDNVTPDVGDCSTGQREIIDLAFKIAAMVQLGLVEYPLSLDEPTSAMDVEHCTMFGSLMKYLLENYPFSQIWLISHDYVHYGSFGSIEACVLCPDNIVVPGKYNEHVEIS